MTKKRMPRASAAKNYTLCTEEFAAQLLVQSDTVRKQVSLTGSYLGIRPVHLPNQRLLWPSDVIEQLLSEQLGEAP